MVSFQVVVIDITIDTKRALQLVFGNATPKEISDYTGLQPGAVSKYLSELVNNYEIVIREKPVVMSRARDTRYFLADNSSISGSGSFTEIHGCWKSIQTGLLN